MNPILLTLAVLLAVLVIVNLWWRTAVRSRSLPCPSWLAWLLENPYVEALGGSSMILTRLGLAPGMKMLDVGCGPGRIAIPAAELVGHEGEVVALDIQPAMLKMLEARAVARGLSNLHMVLGGIGQGLLASNTFDRAILVTVLGEIPDRHAALREIFAALKSGGILSVTEIFPDPHYQSRNTVMRLAKAAGFHFKQRYGHWWAFTMNFEKR